MFRPFCFYPWPRREWRSFPGQFLLVRYGALDGIEDVIEVLSEVFGEEAEDEIPMLLERGVLATVATIGFGVGQMLPSIEFDDQAQILA